MKQAFIWSVLLMAFGHNLVAMDAPKPQIDSIFIKLSHQEIELIYDYFARQLNIKHGNARALADLVNNDTEGSIRNALVFQLRQSEQYQQLKIIIEAKIHHIIQENHEKNIFDFEKNVAELLNVILQSTEINYFCHILKRYEIYLEIFSTKEFASDKAFAFFILNLVNPIISLSAGNNRNVAEMQDCLKRITGPMNLAYADLGQQHVADLTQSLKALFGKINIISDQLLLEFRMLKSSTSASGTPGVLYIADKEILDHICMKYNVDKRVAKKIRNLLVDHNLLLKKTKNGLYKNNGKKKYALNVHS